MGVAQVHTERLGPRLLFQSLTTLLLFAVLVGFGPMRSSGPEAVALASDPGPGPPLDPGPSPTALPGANPPSPPALSDRTEELRAESRSLATRRLARVRRAIPVLMYHEIGDGPGSLYLSASDFAAQLDRLQELGYQTISLRRLYDHMTKGAPVPERSVVLTFDDGYRSFHTRAVPLMKERGFTAALFVITGWVGRPGYVTWDEIRADAAAGFEMAAHTNDHLELPRLNTADGLWEARHSREVLERELGRPVPFFAYPAGRHDDRSVEIVRQAGFAGAVTTLPGPVTPDQDPFRWHRVRIGRGTSAATLERMLRAQ